MSRQRAIWQSPNAAPVRGRVLVRDHVGGHDVLRILWDDGRVGSFVDGHLPVELRLMGGA